MKFGLQSKLWDRVVGGGPGEGGGSWALRGEVSAPFAAGAPSSVECEALPGSIAATLKI